MERRQRRGIIAPASEARKEGASIPDSGVVTVASKLPYPLQLAIWTQRDAHEQVMGGGTRPIKIAEKVQRFYNIYGTSVPPNTQPRCLIVGGYALTKNIPAEFMREWFRQNADSALVKNKIIAAHDGEGRILGWAREHAEIKTRLEPLDMNNREDPRRRGIRRIHDAQTPMDVIEKLDKALPKEEMTFAQGT